MALLAIKRYIKEHEEVTKTDLINRFDVSEEALEAMVILLIEQGHVQKIDHAGPACSTGGCNCNMQDEVYYHWLDKAYKPFKLGLEIK